VNVIDLIRVKVADYAVARGDGVIGTLGLGSCVAITLYDHNARVGGLAHILLPNEGMSRDSRNRAKFPGTAVPMLIDEMKRLGAKGPFTGKLVGGASMFGNLLPAGGINMGDRNVAASRQALVAAQVDIVGQETGGDFGRSVFLHVRDGRLVVRSIKYGERVV
jgi:chemotaxis protein CheD